HLQAAQPTEPFLMLPLKLHPKSALVQTDSKLLGDYDKVKALSEGSDCRCKCVVRPLSKSACRRIEEGNASAQDFYTVETITSGPHCKCACLAPPSAVNPCEGEYRLQKLREAGNENVKLSTILELLEGSFYGMDLLKLHSVTYKLLDRMDRVEKSFSINIRNSSSKVRNEVRMTSYQEECSCRTLGVEMFSVVFQRRSVHRAVLAATQLQGITGNSCFDTCKGQQQRAGHHGDPEKYEKFAGDDPPRLQKDGSVQIFKGAPLTGPRTTINKAAPRMSRTGSNGMIIRGMTFYKSGRGDASWQAQEDPSPGLTWLLPLLSQPASTSQSDVATETTRNFTETSEDVAMASTVPPVTATVPVVRATPKTAPVEPIAAPATATPTQAARECKDTLATISEPVTHNTYGRNEGAWMKDPLSGNDKIYVTNFYYGNNLLEFRNLEVFKTGRFTNSYKLPYNWIGTGHVVYNGAFYYSRAFSRDIIKFDLRHRQVAAWTMLHDALIEESSSPWEWRSQSSVTFAVDESGLWIVYPALDEERFMQEMIVLSRLNPTDLSMQPETTWRTGLKRNRYGNCFIVCGVLYAVDSYNEKDAKLEYAFDTHTNTQMIPRMPFTNNYTYTTQIDYNPKEGVLYAWDNGHQVTYNIKFAY
uniref:Olfactomedin-like 2Ba n=1 Tax=Tetraodon nigroviridis TaxID=99883 RepID=H3CZB3_TETNG